jgi:primosomal replication protein N
MNTFGTSNEAWSSITTGSSNQTPGYLSANTPRKQKLIMEIKSEKQEINNFKEEYSKFKSTII